VRDEHGRLVAALARTTGGDLALAEDALQAAIEAALVQWPTAGWPDRPAGWLLRVARHKAIDVIRRDRSWAGHRATLESTWAEESVVPDSALGEVTIPDERLRLIFACCHPALRLQDRVCLTLRTLCGLTTEELAASFLVDSRSMAQRLVRAKRKIKVAGIPFGVPDSDAWPARMGGVLHVVRLVFTQGYAASAGDSLLRAELCNEAIRLGAVLAEVAPDEGEVHGLLALMLLQDSRRHARTGSRGELILLRDQDRSLWDVGRIHRGMRALGEALRHGPPGPMTLEAAIASVHARAPIDEATDWQEIVALYEILERAAPSPVVTLNRAAALSMVDAAAGLALMDSLLDSTRLARGHLLPAARADVLRRLGRWGEAAAAYRVALSRVQNTAERDYLQLRLVEAEGS
jgi:RNA polymerase sigma-70 factor, ECF subfamily